MKQKIAAMILTSLFLVSIPIVPSPDGGGEEKAKNCLTIIVGKDASPDGSVLLGHNEDIEANTCMHIYTAAKTQYDAGEIIETYYGAEVPQVEETYAYFCVKVFNKIWVPGDFAGGINEFQVVIANNLTYSKETKMRPLSNPNAGQILWSEFMQIALERSKTAIEAVNIISWLVEEYGLALDPGIMFGVSDPNEGWWIEVGWKHWIAKRVPDNAREMRANYFRIETEFDLSSPDVIDFAITQGWYDPNTGPLNWRDAYGDPESSGWAGWNWLREWRVDSLLEEYAPDGVSLPEITNILRDHYESTEYDETTRYQRGSPHDFDTYWTICNKNTINSFVAKSRSWLPGIIGGVMWTAFSRPCTSTYVPWYTGITETPLAYRIGTNEYKKNSAWWAFARLGDIVDRRYKEKTQNVRDAWARLEAKKFQGTLRIEETALQLYNGGDVTGARNVLTKYSCTQGLEAMNFAKQLSKKKLRFIRTWF